MNVRTLGVGVFLLLFAFPFAVGAAVTRTDAVSIPFGFGVRDLNFNVNADDLVVFTCQAFNGSSFGTTGGSSEPGNQFNGHSPSVLINGTQVAYGRIAYLSMLSEGNGSVSVWSLVAPQTGPMLIRIQNMQDANFFGNACSAVAYSGAEAIANVTAVKRSDPFQNLPTSIGSRLLWVNPYGGAVTPPMDSMEPLDESGANFLGESNPTVTAGDYHAAGVLMEIASKEPPKPDPVIIIPGILGSEKVDGNWVIDPILHTYDDLFDTLDANGFTPEEDLFTFPYDWRKSNVDTALQLKEKINQVKTICNCGKVDLVAHSMGGLVARQYIQSEDYENDVEQLIFLGTPHQGAPKAYLMWEGGEVGPLFPISGTLLEKVLSLEAEEKGYGSLFDYIQNEPIESVKQLLPVYDYLFDGSAIRQYPTNYPSNSFLELLNESIANLKNSGVRLTNFVGKTDSSQTVIGVQVTQTDEFQPMWSHGYPIDFYSLFGDHGLIHGFGDGTVPFSSASFVDVTPVISQDAHNALPAALEGPIYRLLTGIEAETLSHKYDSLPKKILQFLMHSPADLLVIDPQGREIGKKNGENINNIPGAFYTGFDTSSEYITILNPAPGNYKIISQGTGTGSYKLEAVYINEATSTAATFEGHTASGLATEFLLSVQEQGSNNIGVVPTDSEPPIVKILQPIAKDYLRSETLAVDVSASDPSGLFSLEARLGTTTIASQSSIDLFFKKLGSYTLSVSSTDNVGNATSSKRIFRVIATADSTLSDIERAYSLGWMTKATRDYLVKKFTAAIKISKLVQKTVDGKPNGTLIQKTVDKILAAALLLELNKLRGKGLNEQGYQVLREDIQWLINN